MVTKKKTTKKPVAKKIHPSHNKKLVETLDKIEKEFTHMKTEKACYVTKKGECLFCTTNGKRNSVTPTDKEIARIKKEGRNLITTHSHPRPYTSSLTKEDMTVAINNNSRGIRAVTPDYTYVAIAPKNKKDWGISWQEFEKVYDKHDKETTKEWDYKYQHDKMSKGYYELNLTHEIMNRVSKELKFIYFRFKN